ncbi:hypothetical protein CCMSSC00406_0009470 [Pleurotus cornucopiae]|uniref:Uncharacterized protein n=1 Tax=Pleurotus cornucopiae TaxID=5321 RepID=A0ACB7J4Y3_PLECO|nr:hypothetical protein CCMSSC00406_0009470 [Pleurotus cornucopiae]
MLANSLGRLPIQNMLPVELLAEILAYLTHRTDVGAAMLASRQFHTLLQPHLYKNVKLISYIGDNQLASFTSALDGPCTIYKSRAQQVEELSLTLERPSTNLVGNPVSMTNIYLPIYRLLTKLPNLSRLELKLNRGLTPYAFWRDARANGTPWSWDIMQVDLNEDFQLPITTLIFDVSQWAGECPTNIFRDWLLTQDAVEHFEHVIDSRPCKLLPASFPNLRFLKVAARNFQLLVNDLVGPRPITHLSIVGQIDDISDLEAFRLPDAYNNVNFLSCSSDGSSSSYLVLVGYFRNVEALNVSYRSDPTQCGLAAFLRDLRSHHRTPRTFDKLRCLRVTWVSTGQEGSHAQCPCSGAVADVLAELTKLQCLDVVSGCGESIRFERNGRQWPVRWGCEESDMWRHNWEKDALLDRRNSR